MTDVDAEAYDRVTEDIDIGGLSPEQIRSSVEDVIYHGDRGPHQIKKGFRKGVQRYEMVTGKPKTSEGIAFAHKIAEPLVIQKEIRTAEDIDNTITIKESIDGLPSDTKSIKGSDLKSDLGNKRKDLLDIIKSSSQRKTSIKTLRRMKTFEDSEATKIIEDRMVEVGGITSSTFFGEIRRAGTREEIESIISEVRESELPEKAKEIVIRGAEGKLMEV